MELRVPTKPLALYSPAILLVQPIPVMYLESTQVEEMCKMA